MFAREKQTCFILTLAMAGTVHVDEAILEHFSYLLICTVYLLHVQYGICSTVPVLAMGKSWPNYL